MTGGGPAGSKNFRFPKGSSSNFSFGEARPKTTSFQGLHRRFKSGVTPNIGDVKIQSGIGQVNNFHMQASSGSLLDGF